MEEKQETSLKGISVIVLTQNRITYVERLFNSLHQEMKSFGEPVEVIIIDNSEPKESALIANMCREYKFRFHFFKGSISEARNYGIKAAKFPIVLYIDSDCEIVSGILQEHVTSYTEEKIGGVLGLTDFAGKENWVWKAIERTPFHIAFSFAKRMDYAPWGPCTNISFRKDIVERVGGFKTDFPFDFSGEDVDIGLRINELGYKIKCNPRALVNHNRETWSSFLGFCKKIFRWGRTDFHILKQHPHLSTTDFPKFTTILLLILALSVVFQLTGIGWIMAGLLMTWLLCIPIIEAFLRSYTLEKRITDFVSNYISFWLNFTFELGSVFESLKNGSFSMLYKKITYGQGQLIFEWKQKVLQSWSFIAALVIFLFILTLT
jgi:glycosyltransferase involved in cell wall biosynthesis